MWYLSVLLLCYVFFYVLVRAAERFNFSPCYLFLFMIILGVNIHCFRIDAPLLTATTARGYSAFFTGLVLANILRNWTPKRGVLCLCAALIVLTGVLFCFPLAYPFLGNQGYVMIFLLFPACILLLLYSPLKRVLDHKWIGVLGSVSFDMYIWHLCGIHALILLAAQTGMDLYARPVRLMLVFTLFAWLFGALSYFCIEKPINSLIQKQFEKSFEGQKSENG